jgi:hypothetical protein
MATVYVKKYQQPQSELAAGEKSIGGLKSSRYEKLQVSYGVVQTDGYNTNDVLLFGDIPARDVIRATFIVHTANPAELYIYPGTDVSGELLLKASSKERISYVVEYVRGTGRVGPVTDLAEGETTDDQGDRLKVRVQISGATPASGDENIGATGATGAAGPAGATGATGPA